MSLSLREENFIEKLSGLKSEKNHLAVADKNTVCLTFLRSSVGMTTVCVSIITSYFSINGLALKNSDKGLYPIFTSSITLSINFFIIGFSVLEYSVSPCPASHVILLSGKLYLKFCIKFNLYKASPIASPPE